MALQREGIPALYLPDASLISTLRTSQEVSPPKTVFLAVPSIQLIRSYSGYHMKLSWGLKRRISI